MENSRSKKATTKNLFFARRALNFKQYKELGGQGDEFEYKFYIALNKEKASTIEKIIKEN